MLALASVVAGLTITNKSLPVPLAIVLAIVAAVSVGALCGFINGWVSERWKIHSFVVTLGMLNIARGAALQISNSRTIFSFPAQFNAFGTLELFQIIPAIFLIALALVLIGRFILNRTVFGRMIYAIGNNEEAVRLSGHNTSSVKILAFTICGITVGIAAIMYMLRLNIASPILGVGFELKAIAAVVIGGTSMKGGKGSMVGTFLGACIIGVLDNGLLLIGLGDFVRQMVTGFIIVLAVIIDTYRISASQRAVEPAEPAARPPNLAKWRPHEKRSRCDEQLSPPIAKQEQSVRLTLSQVHSGAMHAQPDLAIAIVGQDLVYFVPEGGAVVGDDEMGELVDDDVVEHGHGGHDAAPVKVEGALYRARGPAMLKLHHPDLADADAQPGGEIGDALRDPFATASDVESFEGFGRGRLCLGFAAKEKIATAQHEGLRLLIHPLQAITSPQVEEGLPADVFALYLGGVEVAPLGEMLVDPGALAFDDLLDLRRRGAAPERARSQCRRARRRC